MEPRKGEGEEERAMTKSYLRWTTEGIWKVIKRPFLLGICPAMLLMIAYRTKVGDRWDSRLDIPMIFMTSLLVFIMVALLDKLYIESRNSYEKYIVSEEHKAGKWE